MRNFRDFFTTDVVDDEKCFVIGQDQNSSLETAHEMIAIIAGGQ